MSVSLAKATAFASGTVVSMRPAARLSRGASYRNQRPRGWRLSPRRTRPRHGALCGSLATAEEPRVTLLMAFVHLYKKGRRRINATQD